MKKLGFQLIFAGSDDPSWKARRSRQHVHAIQNKWDARKQNRRLMQEVHSLNACENRKKI